jgi:hypothetical protein
VVKTFKIQRIIPFIILFFCILSCVEPFEADFSLNQSILVINGTVSDSDTDQFVRIREAIPNGSTGSYFRAILGAKVQIRVNDAELINFVEGAEGYYYAPEGFVGENDKSYSLEFTLENGNVYKSEPQKLRRVSEIDKVYQKTEMEGIVLKGKVVPATHIFLDTKDPAGLGDNYLWTWKNYERQVICVSCYGGRWFNNSSSEGVCISDDRLTRFGTTYDYSCNSKCWDIYQSSEVIAQSDFLSDDLTITGKKIAEIPYYNRTGGLLEINQQSVSEEAYNYLKLLINQGQNTGGLADTPPAALIGNVHNITNPEEPVGGYFLVTSVKKALYWIDRTNADELGIKPYGLLDGREFNPEPDNSAAVPIRPPLAPCLNGPGRTNQKPDGFLGDN